MIPDCLSPAHALRRRLLLRFRASPEAITMHIERSLFPACLRWERGRLSEGTRRWEVLYNLLVHDSRSFEVEGMI